ncbi:MAG: PD-(D/E)XK nuclease family protein, partial [Bacteroidales bacterium]|nr:PD-(D/E)XK nuclease family protein [Bacteroidales bacterium]
AFNDALLKVGHNPIEATLEDANSSVLQLFKLTLLMFAEPNNFRNIVSYLTTRPCPVAHGDKLGSYLLEHCGWGDETEWKNFIDGLGKDKDGNLLKKKDGTQMYSDEEIDGMKNDFQGFKNFLQDIKDKTQGKIIIKEINELYDKTKKYNEDPIVRAQLKNVREFCKHILALLEETHEYTPEEIKKLVDRIFSAGNYKMDSATTESFFTYPSLECVYGTVTDGRVVWVDCYGELLPDYDYDFLSVADINYLNGESITIWKNTEQVAAKLALLSLAAKHAGKEVILFVPQNAQGERVKQSPLLTDLGLKPEVIKTKDENEENQQELTEEEKLQEEKESGRWLLLNRNSEDVVEFASKPETDYYEIPEGIAIPQREHESYSSLDLLIQSPFDYVLKYACGLYAPEVDQLEGLSRICGTVAHKTLENLNAKYKGDLDKMQNDVDNNLDKCIEDAAKQCGIVLLLPENRFDLDKLKQDLKNAFTNLIGILQNNNLEIVGMEMGYSENPSAIVSGNELEAKIDLVLKDEEGKILIFDLKYGKPTYYRKNLEENKALQLDVYKYCVENETNGKKETVRMVGYFNLKEGKLYTRDNSLKQSDNVVVVDKVASNAIPAGTNIMELVKNSYNYRFEEFNGEKHHIEEAEGVLAKDKYDKSKTLIASTKLDYCRDRIDKKVALYPLKLKKNNDSEGSEKAENIFSDYKLFKGGSK